MLYLNNRNKCLLLLLLLLLLPDGTEIMSKQEPELGPEARGHHG